MATAPEIQAEADVSNDDAPIDYEAEAKRLGWRPQEEFKGDPSQHVDAKTFYERGQEMMPILKAQNKQLVKRLEQAERVAKQASEFFSKAEQRAYERAVADIRAEQEAAVESGDVTAHRKAVEALDKLEKPAASAPAAQEDGAEMFADWSIANKWYATNPAMQAYADAQANKLAKERGGGLLDRAGLDEVAEKVKARFADDFPEAFAATPKPRPRSPVEGVGTGPARRSGHTFNDLPAEAKAVCDKWVKSGIIKSREDYVKNFDFKGYGA